MSISLDTAGALVMKSSGTGVNVHKLTINTPASLSADRTISISDPGADTTLAFNVANRVTYAGANIQLTTAQSGSIIIVPNVAGNGTITLPAVANSAGCSFRVICSGAVSNANNAIVSCGAAVQKGGIFDGTGRASAVGTSIQLGNGTGAMTIGDELRYISDGTNWYVTAYMADRTHVTVA